MTHPAGTVLQESITLLQEAGIGEAVADAEVICSHVLEEERFRLRLEGETPVSDERREEVLELVRRRCQGEPVAYLTGEKEFYSLPFDVNRSVLIPRPETELLVDLAIYFVPYMGSALEIGTGSGAVAVALKHTRSDVSVTATDISPEALETARSNSEILLGDGSIEFLEGDCLEPAGERTFDLILSNPPYIDPALRGTLQAELSFEPETALFCEDRGRGVTERILREGKRSLNPGGRILLEIGHDMADYVKELGRDLDLDISVMKDYSGFDRIMVAVPK
jgi:release factor glutamine methyltransferase